jgi:hypothetical protein
LLVSTSWKLVSTFTRLKYPWWDSCVGWRSDVMALSHIIVMMARMKRMVQGWQ